LILHVGTNIFVVKRVTNHKMYTQYWWK